MNLGEEISASLEVITVELDKFSEIHDCVKFKAEILKAATLLMKYKDHYDWNFTQVIVMEVVYKIRDALKELVEKEPRAEERLGELRQFWNITVMSPLVKRLKKVKREWIEKKKTILELKTRIIYLKRKVRQGHIMLQYKNDLMLKVAEDECIEDLQSRMNVG